MPVAYPSVLLDGQPNLDGGITDNLPIKPLYDMGLRHIVAINIAKEEDLLIPAVYPGTEFIEIRPSRDIGHLLDGTLDFSAQGARFRMELGYRDTLRTLRAYENGELNHPDFMRKAAIEAAAEALGDDGRILVRESGTEPLIRVMVEAGTDDLCHKYVDSVVDVMEAEGLVVE